VPKEPSFSAFSIISIISALTSLVNFYPSLDLEQKKSFAVFQGIIVEESRNTSTERIVERCREWSCYV